MTLLLDIAPHIPPASPETTGAEIYRRFQDEPDTMAIAVVEADGTPVGLIERNAFLVLMAAQYGYALWAKRPAAQMMKRDPVVIDGDVTVEEFCGSVLVERPSELLHGFIVTCAHVLDDPRRNDYFVWLDKRSYRARVVGKAALDIFAGSEGAP